MDPYPQNGSVSSKWIRILKMDPDPQNGSGSSKWIRILKMDTDLQNCLGTVPVPTSFYVAAVL